MEVLFLQQFCVRFAQSTASEYVTMLDARVSELFQSVGCSRGECLPSNSVCNAYEREAMLESSVSSMIEHAEG